MSITEHCAQTAASAEKAGESKEAQLSCLLHDVGHLLGLEAGNPMGMDGCGTPDHERIGAEFLGALGFSTMVSFCSLHHVNAKRYLCRRTPGYFEKLTPASRTTLDFQGGIMSEEECLEVETDPLWPLVLRMREYDEAGKDPTIEEQPPLHYSGVMNINVQNSHIETEKRFPTSPYASTYVLSSEQLDRLSDEMVGDLLILNAWNEANLFSLQSQTFSDLAAQFFENDEANRVDIYVEELPGDDPEDRTNNTIQMINPSIIDFEPAETNLVRLTFER